MVNVGKYTIHGVNTAESNATRSFTQFTAFSRGPQFCIAMIYPQKLGFNKALLGEAMVNKPLIRLYFSGRVRQGGLADQPYSIGMYRVYNKL